jgi:hypothetical protein
MTFGELQSPESVTPPNRKEIRQAHNYVRAIGRGILEQLGGVTGNQSVVKQEMPGTAWISDRLLREHALQSRRHSRLRVNLKNVVVGQDQLCGTTGLLVEGNELYVVNTFTDQHPTHRTKWNWNLELALRYATNPDITETLIVQSSDTHQQRARLPKIGVRYEIKRPGYKCVAATNVDPTASLTDVYEAVDIITAAIDRHVTENGIGRPRSSV